MLKKDTLETNQENLNSNQELANIKVIITFARCYNGIVVTFIRESESAKRYIEGFMNKIMSVIGFKIFERGNKISVHYTTLFTFVYI